MITPATASANRLASAGSGKGIDAPAYAGSAYNRLALAARTRMLKVRMVYLRRLTGDYAIAVPAGWKCRIKGAFHA
jgi:hypothetical protein